MFHSLYNLGGSHRVFEVDGDNQLSGGTAKRAASLGVDFIGWHAYTSVSEFKHGWEGTISYENNG